ncbi:NUDIX hydrolase [uncultured Robinsoniella sp.]|uniref:NUDIX hydrolase n=1 Tax=uncultured Robinsoniella sp. TaxID=904190 RepID=UPI00374FA6A4
MSRIRHIDKLTDSRHLNLYELEARNRLGNPVDYFVASRAKEIDNLKISTHNLEPDGVIIYSLYGDKKDKVILIRQYRYAIDGYIYEFPAGLVDPGEDYRTAGARELKEETGLDFHSVKVDEMYEKPYFTTIGMTDECCATVYGFATGEISKDGLEDNEDIEVIIADREEVRRILKEERVAIMCAYMLMHFLKDQDDPFAFLK